MLPVTVNAQTLLFERATIAITSPPPNSNDKELYVGHEPLSYDVESRTEDALRLEYIHALNTLTSNTGVLINFAGPTIVALPPMKVYTPVDALFLDENGTVLQISPNITLAEINQLVQARAPIKAFLFLKGGEATARLIRPRDRVSGSMFNAPILVQE